MSGCTDYCIHDCEWKLCAEGTHWATGQSKGVLVVLTFYICWYIAKYISIQEANRLCQNYRLWPKSKYEGNPFLQKSKDAFRSEGAFSSGSYDSVSTIRMFGKVVVYV